MRRGSARLNSCDPTLLALRMISRVPAQRLDHAGDLMIDFYHHLRAGLPTSEALRRAQLDLIASARERTIIDRWLDRMRGRDASGETRAHPFHWAGFQVSESSRAP